MRTRTSSREATPPRFRKQFRIDLLERARGLCSYCDSELLQLGRWDVDHVHPRYHGGGDEPGNLVASCTRCNCVVLVDLPLLVAAFHAERAHPERRRRPWRHRIDERIEALRLRTGRTFWERRAYVQQEILTHRAKRWWMAAVPSPYAEVCARVAHLTPAARGRPRPSACATPATMNRQIR